MAVCVAMLALVGGGGGGGGGGDDDTPITPEPVGCKGVSTSRTTIGSVTWDTSQKPGPPEFHQDPTLVNKALFQIPATLLSGGSAVQNVTFRVTVDPYGSLDAVRTDNPAQPLTATLTVAGLRQLGGADVISTTSEFVDADGQLVCTARATLVHGGAA